MEKKKKKKKAEIRGETERKRGSDRTEEPIAT